MRPVNRSNTQNLDSLWPHRLAVTLLWATFPLIWMGGLVTSYDAGMAVPDWPTTFGYNMFLYPWQKWLFGPWNLFIEHGHRLLGAIVGMLTILVVAAVWRFDRRGWMRFVALGALAAVIFQGGLGGMRVIQNEVLLAKVHGCVAPAVFALFAAMAVFTSRTWKLAPPVTDHPTAGKLHRLALLTTVLAYAQLLLGAELRHIAVDATPGAFRAVVVFHLLMAGVVMLHALVLAVRVWRLHGDQRPLVQPAMALGGLVALQLVLGGGTWVVKYSWPGWLSQFHFAARFTVEAEGMLQALIVTGHVATGSLILATGVLLSLRSFRLVRGAAPQLGSKAMLTGVIP